MIGVIYEIKHTDGANYIGSTFQTPQQRFSNHCVLAKTYAKNSKLYTHMKSNLIGDTFQGYQISALEVVNYGGAPVAESKKALHEREQFHINQVKPTLNVRRAVADLEDQAQKRRAWAKKNYQEHTEEKKRYFKQYYEKNRQAVFEVRKVELIAFINNSGVKIDKYGVVREIDVDYNALTYQELKFIKRRILKIKASRAPVDYYNLCFALKEVKNLFANEEDKTNYAAELINKTAAQLQNEYIELT